MRLTPKQFAKHMEELQVTASKAMDYYSAIEQNYGEAILGLTTVPRFWTRVKMAILPGRWPHVNEGTFAYGLALLHGQLAALKSRARMLQGIDGVEAEDERKDAAKIVDADERDGVEWAQRNDIPRLVARAIAISLWGLKAVAGETPATRFVSIRRYVGSQAEKGAAAFGWGVTYLEALAAAGNPINDEAKGSWLRGYGELLDIMGWTNDADIAGENEEEFVRRLAGVDPFVRPERRRVDDEAR